MRVGPSIIFGMALVQMFVLLFCSMFYVWDTEEKEEKKKKKIEQSKSTTSLRNVNAVASHHI
tara:strand:+ start:200 stop:385 length:186 start_codon:yes stop_codon:yes gene_type:complete